MKDFNAIVDSILEISPPYNQDKNNKSKGELNI